MSDNDKNYELVASVIFLANGQELLGLVARDDEVDMIAVFDPLVLSRNLNPVTGDHTYLLHPWASLSDDRVYFVRNESVVTTAQLSDSNRQMYLKARNRFYIDKNRDIQEDHPEPETRVQETTKKVLH